ncbi:G-protein coupled receptor Mth2-like [Epargyreus clarus]|uniref:G-protein coupled receptor Mth2-like n=1 Tax=Epargyreus clarus TaxID=520877 RepID=UPI003C2ADE93
MIQFTLVALVLNTNYIGDVFSAYVDKEMGYLRHTRSIYKEIPKCCAEYQVIVMDYENYTVSCQDYPEKLPFTNLDIYDKIIHEKQSKKQFSDIFRVVPEKRPNDTALTELYMIAELMLQPYLSEDGIVYLEYPNAYERWIPINDSNYCVDYELLNGNISENFKFLCNIMGDPPKGTNLFFTAALCVSSVFLVLVLVVYLLLPGLRNLGGMVLMAYVFSLLFAFIHLVIIQLGEHVADVCVNLTTTTYFFFLASFCWMNVMSYDIWWTFRGYAKARMINRRGETFKFLMYCLYGFGVPLAMSIAFVMVNRADLRHLPWVVKPLVPEQGCFIEGGQKLLYLYVPMLILIILNWIFFLMTAFNIWRLHRATAVLDSTAAGTPAAHRSQKQRFFIYLKLSIIMGVNWILEVVSSVTPDFQFWFITDAYNLLIGLAIFLIFVCKKKIYYQVVNRFKNYKKPQRSLAKSQTSCTTLSNSSQDTPLQVYSHPNGTSVRR